jgi:hypothetical protein
MIVVSHITGAAVGAGVTGARVLLGSLVLDLRTVTPTADAASC